MASSDKGSPAATKDKKSPPSFYIEGILRDTKERKEGEQLKRSSHPASLLPASTTYTSMAPSRLQVSSLTSPVNSFISTPFPGIDHFYKSSC